MVNCPHCGAENGERNLRCSLCGKPLPQGAVPQAAPGAAPPTAAPPTAAPPAAAPPTAAPPAAAPPGQPYWPGAPAADQPQPGSGGTYGYIYDNQPAPAPAPRRGAYTPPPPGARSMSERITYRDVQPQAGGVGVKIGLGLGFNKHAVVSAVLILILGTLFIVATYMPWLELKNFGDKEYTGWDLYELGKSGEYGGSSFHIPNIFNINSKSEFDTSSGIILTGVWTLTGGILLAAIALLLPFLNRSYLCIIVMVVGLVMLVASGFNLATVLIAKGQLYWPIYVLPAAGLAAIIVGYDARHHF